MRDNCSLICKTLPEIAEMERAQKGKMYPIGTLYIQVSACKRGGKDAWLIVSDKAQMIEDKYAVAIPSIGIVPRYLLLALQAVTPEWHRKYVGTNINISMDAFRYLKVYINPDIRIQMEVVAQFDIIDREIELIEEQVNFDKECKKWMLNKMFP